MATDTGSLPQVAAAAKPVAMRFQPRDWAILRALYEYDGLLAKRHLKYLFWPKASLRAMEMRLALLHRQGYIDWPSGEQRRLYAIAEPICWLGWKGMLWLAGGIGGEIKLSHPPRERQLRQLERSLRGNGLRWQREPRWSQLAHDLAVVDFRLAVEAALRSLPAFSLETWQGESTFLSQMDTVEYASSPSIGARRKARGVRLDGYFVLLDGDRLRQGKPARARFLVELDNATHDTASFGREKVAPGVAYIRSETYKVRFGENTGRWLVVTTSETRLKHLLAQTQAQAGEDADIFLFTTINQAREANVLASPIWRLAGRQAPISITSA